MGYKQLGRVLLVLLASVTSGSARQDWHRDHDTYFRDQRWHAHVFARVREDLDHIYTARAASDRERRRLERTREELTGLQAKLDQGMWDNGTVNDVIDSLRKSANDDRLGPRDRQILAEDAERIHDFQANHNRWMRH
jgi:hypothetical protein